MARREIIPIAAAERIIKQSGGVRVSEGAAKELANSLEELGKEIATQAAKFAIHAGRKTVKAADIKLATK